MQFFKSRFILTILLITVSVSLLMGCQKTAPPIESTSVIPKENTISINEVKETDETEAQIVEFKSNETYTPVSLNYDGNTHYDIGYNYGQLVKDQFPDYESDIEAYLIEMIGDEETYNEMLNRVHEILPQLNENYIKEMTGFSDGLSGHNTTVYGDGLLSKDEIYLLNIVPDVIRDTSCSALAVFNEKSNTGNTIVGRHMDWPIDSRENILKYHTVTSFNNKEKSIVTVGYIGILSCLTGFNNNNIFAAELDGNSNSEYIATRKKSYSFDMRYALEETSSLEAYISYMQDDKHLYTYGHSIIVSDESKAVVIENSIDGEIKSSSIRTSTSELKASINWPHKYAICSVNSFLLENLSDSEELKRNNKVRWEGYHALLDSASTKMSSNDLEAILSEEDVRLDWRQQSVIYDHHSRSLLVDFRQVNDDDFKPLEFLKVKY